MWAAQLATFNLTTGNFNKTKAKAVEEDKETVSVDTTEETASLLELEETERQALHDPEDERTEFLIGIFVSVWGIDVAPKRIQWVKNLKVSGLVTACVTAMAHDGVMNHPAHLNIPTIVTAVRQFLDDNKEKMAAKDKKLVKRLLKHVKKNVRGGRTGWRDFGKEGGSLDENRTDRVSLAEPERTTCSSDT